MNCIGMVTSVTSFLRRGWIARASPHFFALHMAAMASYSAATVLSAEEWLSAITILTVALAAGFSLAHAIETRGVLTGLLLAGSAVTITMLSEAIGVVTGLPFGHYVYTGQLGPKAFGLVPFIIPVAWFMVLYPAHETVRFLFARLAPPAWRNSRWKAALTQCALAAIAMTAWDLSLDPRMVSAGYWVWRDGGAYFGIPLSNFAGWLLTSFVIFVTWRALDRPPALPASSHPTAVSVHATLPVLIYIIMWLGESIASALFWSGPVVGLAVFVGMGLFAGPALALLIHSWLTTRNAMPRAMWRASRAQVSGEPQRVTVDISPERTVTGRLPSTDSIRPDV